MTRDAVVMEASSEWTAAREVQQRFMLRLGPRIDTLDYSARCRQLQELGGDFYERNNKPKVVARLVARLKKLGYEVQVTPTGEPERLSVEPELPPLEPLVYEQTVPPLDLQQVPFKRRRGRPCKCVERGIICKHQEVQKANLLELNGGSAGRFS